MCVDDLELVIHAGTIWKLTIQVEGMEEDGMKME